MATVTKKQLVERIAQKTGQSQLAVKHIVQLLFDQVIDELASDNRLEFRDFGVFVPVRRKARTGRNPKTGETVGVPSKRAVAFKMGKSMRDLVAGRARKAGTRAKTPRREKGPSP